MRLSWLPHPRRAPSEGVRGLLAAFQMAREWLCVICWLFTSSGTSETSPGQLDDPLEGSLPILLWLEARPERYFQVMGTMHHTCGSYWPGPQPRGCATQAFSDEVRLCYWLWPVKHGRRDVYLFKGDNSKASTQIASFSVPAKQKSCQPTLGYWKSEK